MITNTRFIRSTPVLTYSDVRKQYEFECHYLLNDSINPKKKGFRWSKGVRKWITKNKNIAKSLLVYADDIATKKLDLE